MAKYDWDTAQQLFVDGVSQGEDAPPQYLNLRELAEQMGIPYQQVRERAARHRWTSLRQKAILEMAQAKRRKRAERLATEGSKMDDTSLDVAKMGMTLIRLRMGEIAEHVKAKQEQRKRSLDLLKDGNPVEWTELYSAINYKEMQGLAIAATTLHDLGQKALGTDAININVKGGVDVGVTGEVTVSVVDEMTRPDPERIAVILGILSRVNLPHEHILGLAQNGNVIEGEVEETAPELPEGAEE